MELKLWAAVLQQAFYDLSKTGKSKETMRIRDGAIHWFFYSNLSGVGSLKFICDALDLSVNFVRAAASKLLVI